MNRHLDRTKNCAGFLSVVFIDTAKHAPDRRIRIAATTTEKRNKGMIATACDASEASWKVPVNSSRDVSCGSKIRWHIGGERGSDSQRR